MRRILGLFASMAILLLPQGGLLAAAGETGGKAVFDLREVSAPATLHLNRLGYGEYPGQWEFCETRPDKEVKEYPSFKSDRPLYGKATLAWDPRTGKSGGTFHFAIDESGGKLPEWMREIGGELIAGVKRLYLYDRLYFDVNGDLDLTNDPVLAALPAIPREIPLGKGERRASRMFPPVDVTVDLGPDLGKRRVRLVPLLSILAHRRPAEMLVLMPAVARQGRIRLGSREFGVLLSQVDGITGGLDRPWAFLSLSYAGTSKRDDWWRGTDQLGAMRVVDGRLYRLSATPSGDRLTVEPYGGEFGDLEVRTPRKGVGRPAFSGTLMSCEQEVVPVGIRTVPAESQLVEQAKVPVGDYLPLEFYVDVGRTQARFTRFCDEAQPAGAKRDEGDYVLAIRKDKPCAVKLSPRATFVFPAPFVFDAADPTGKTFHPGDDIRVDAYLLDPALGIVSGLWDKTKKMDPGFSFPKPIAGKVRITGSSGRRLELDEDSDTLSWGGEAFCFRWWIPEDLPITGKRETFTITFRLDTQDLYGVIEGTTKVVMEAR